MYAPYVIQYRAAARIHKLGGFTGFSAEPPVPIAPVLKKLGLPPMKYYTIIRFNEGGPSNCDEMLRHVRWLPHLKTLPLDHTNVTNRGLDHLRHLERVEHLGFWETRVTDDGLAAIYHLVMLARFD